MDIKELINLAIEARKNAYAPYSNYKVGAALLTDNDKVYTGCNIENAAYTPTICAERTAFYKAISEGEKNFEKMVLICGYDEPECCMPCGVCLQVMNEFCNDNFEIISAKNYEEYKIYKLRDLFPYKFNLK